MQKDLDIQEYTDPEHDPMIPHTLVLKPGLIVHSVYNGYWFWGRPSIDDLWRDLTTEEVRWRPDETSSAIGWHLGHQAHVAHFMVRNLTAAFPRCRAANSAMRAPNARAFSLNCSSVAAPAKGASP